MVKIQLVAWQAPPAILAGTIVPSVNIIPTEAHLSFGHSVVAHQQHHAGYTDHAVYQTDGFISSGNRKIAPAFKIERLILLVNRLGDPLIEQNEGPTNRGDMDRQIGTVKDQNFGVEDGIGGR